MTCEMAHPLQIGIIAYDGVQALDIVGPADAFAAAIISENGRERVRGYKVALIGLGSRPIRSESGIVFQPGFTVRDSPEIDTLIVPGGVALRLNPQTQHKVAQFLREQSKRIRRIAAVCTGVYGIAPSGVLDGRRVTTHWRFASDLATRFPKLKVDANALYLKDGSFYSSAGITAGIDLSLALIEED